MLTYRGCKINTLYLSDLKIQKKILFPVTLQNFFLFGNTISLYNQRYEQIFSLLTKIFRKILQREMLNFKKRIATTCRNN